jgi:ATP-dependent helicase/nuclease subunit B
MPLPTLLIQASPRFWQDLVEQLAHTHWLKPGFPGASNDYSSLRIIVPTFEHAKLFQQALGEYVGRDFVPPRVSTLFALLGMQIPSPEKLRVSAPSERLMSLFAELRQHAWLKKLFGADSNTDLLPLAQALLDLSDELTQAFLPINVKDSARADAQANAMRERWLAALAQLPAPVNKIISDEAQLVWTIWQSQLDQGDPTVQRLEKLMQITANASEPLLWIAPGAPNPMEKAFLDAYQDRQPVLVVHLDWRMKNLPAILVKAWPDFIDTAAEIEIHDLLKQANDVGYAHDAQLQNIAVMAADSVEDEAQKAAQTIVQWLEQGKQEVAIIAQDRVVARRIRALLERAQIFVADETGWKLSTTRAASLLVAWFDVVSTRADTFALLDLLKSPFVTFYLADEDNNEDKTSELELRGDTQSRKDALVMQIEMSLRRANVVGTWESILAAIEDQTVARGWIKRLAFYARKFSGAKSLSAWCTLNQQMFLELGWQRGLEQDEAGRQMLQMLQAIERDCQTLSGQFTFAEWRGFVSLQFESTPFIAPSKDRRVVMLPLNGAHLRTFDAVFVVGADAAHLPSRPKETLFFTNAVRRECGLVTNQERRRQQLRDFAELLLTNPQVVISWQAQRDGEDNPVSPWLAQLELSLEQAGLPCLQRHDVLLMRQNAVSQITVQPRPRAAVLAPKTLSSSAYASLVACPYQFFAGRMLRLNAIDELSDLPEKRDYGDWLHAILKSFHDELKLHPIPPGEERQARLSAMSEQLFQRVLKKTPAALGYQVRWEKVIPAYLDWLQQKESQGWQFDMGEVWRERQIAWDGGEVLLRGRVDRIDKKMEGGSTRLYVLDYKTKTASSLKTRLKNGEDHQLPFYGLLANEIDQAIEGASYVALELERKSIGDVEAISFKAWVEALEQAIINDMQAIQGNAGLPAHGAESSCQYCEMRGLCRKGVWQ